jgi:hypothetical protein
MSNALGNLINLNLFAYEDHDEDIWGKLSEVSSKKLQEMRLSNVIC